MTKNTIRITQKGTPRRILLAFGHYYQAYQHGVARYAKQAGWILDTTSAHTLQLPMHWRGNGIITNCVSINEIQQLLTVHPVPIVDLGGNLDIPNTPHFIHDYIELGQAAVKHFVERDFTNLVYFANYFGQPHLEPRMLNSFMEAAQEAGCTVHPLLWPDAIQKQPALIEKGIIHWLQCELAKLPKPMGIFTIHDDLGIKLLDACMSIGLRVPEQAAILGCHNDEITCDFAAVPLSSIDSRREEQAYQAAAALDAMLDKQLVPPTWTYIAPGEVITRKSSDILAIENVDVAAALRFIMENFHQAISVQDIADNVGLSLRRLQIQFQKHLNRTLIDELVRQRLNYARKLLRETNLKAIQIADQAGFSSANYMSQAFKRVLNTTPRDYRKQYLTEME